MSGKQCPRCGRSYGSATHARHCRGLSGASLRQWRHRRNRSRSGSGGCLHASSVLCWTSSPQPGIADQPNSNIPAVTEGER